MTYIGYIIKDALAVPLTHGEETDMLAWKQENLALNNTTDLFALPAGEDANRCLSDFDYFRSLMP